MRNETICPECGKKVTESQDAPFCSYICGWNHDERNSRHVGAYSVNEYGDFEDRESDYNYRSY